MERNLGGSRLSKVPDPSKVDWRRFNKLIYDDHIDKRLVNINGKYNIQLFVQSGVGFK